MLHRVDSRLTRNRKFAEAIVDLGRSKRSKNSRRKLKILSWWLWKLKDLSTCDTDSTWNLIKQRQIRAILDWVWTTSTIRPLSSIKKDWTRACHLRMIRPCVFNLLTNHLLRLLIPTCLTALLKQYHELNVLFIRLLSEMCSTSVRKPQKNFYFEIENHEWHPQEAYKVAGFLFLFSQKFSADSETPKEQFAC